jgi:hypothetical protein
MKKLILSFTLFAALLSGRLNASGADTAAAAPAPPAPSLEQRVAGLEAYRPTPIRPRRSKTRMAKSLKG